MHGTSVSGVSFTRLSHCDEVTAPAPVGTSSTATAQQKVTSQRCRNRGLLTTGMRASLSISPLCPNRPRGTRDARREALARGHRFLAHTTIRCDAHGTPLFVQGNPVGEPRPSMRV